MATANPTSTYRMRPVQAIHQEFFAVIEDANTGHFIWSGQHPDRAVVEEAQSAQYLLLMAARIVELIQLGYALRDTSGRHARASARRFQWVNIVKSRMQPGEPSSTSAAAWAHAHADDLEYQALFGGVSAAISAHRTIEANTEIENVGAIRQASAR